MIRKYSDLLKEQKNAPFDGTGEIMVRSLLNGPDELYHKGRVFAHTTVYPGSAIGYHVHTDESETYYILKGTARYNDNGTISRRQSLRPIVFYIFQLVPRLVHFFHITPNYHR